MRLTAPQLALVRCWAEGLDLCDAWSRYLPHAPRPDPRTARAAVARWRGQLAILARAHGQHEVAVLLRRDPEAMAEPAEPVTSLEDFRAAQPEDFYTESELLALYQAEHGRPDARSAARRKQRLRQRLLSALQGLERLAVARQVRSTDPLAQWLDERLAHRLAAAGLLQVGDLLQHLQRHGPAWHRGVARVGAVAARRVEAWLLDAHRSAVEAAAVLGAWSAAPNAAVMTTGAPHALAAGDMAPAVAIAADLLAATPGPPGSAVEVLRNRRSLEPLSAAGAPGHPGALALPQWLLNPAPQTGTDGLARAQRAEPPAWTRLASPHPAQTATTATANDAATAAASVPSAPSAQSAGSAQSARPAPSAPPTTPPAAAPGDDQAMLQAWLAGQVPGSATWRASRKECERYLLWVHWLRGKTLVALTPDDVHAYTLFLRRPDAAWCGPRQAVRHSPAWRPFEGPLLGRSLLAAVAVLRRFSAWLLHTGRQPRDPWHEAGHAVVTDLVRPAGRAMPLAAPPLLRGPLHAPLQQTLNPPPHQPHPPTHPPAHPPAQPQPPGAGDEPAHLRAEDLQLLQRWCAHQPDNPPNRRRLAVLHLVLDGLRLRELAQARVLDLRMPDPRPGGAAGLAPVPAAQRRGRNAAPDRFVQPSPQAPRVQAEGHWLLHVRSPAGQADAATEGRSVCLSPATLAALARHWHDRGLVWPLAQALPGYRSKQDLIQVPNLISTGSSSPEPALPDLDTDRAQPLVAGLRASTGRPRPVGDSQLYLLLRQACMACADDLMRGAAGQGGLPFPTRTASPNAAATPDEGLLAQARRLRAATPQALRLAAAAAALQQGARLRDVQQRLGHRSAASTAALLPD